MAFWDKLVDGAVDIFTDPETIDKAIDYFMREEGLTYGEARKLALEQAKINTPDIKSPFGSSITTWDDDTGRATVNKVMPQGILDLGNALARSLGGQPNTPRQAGPGSWARSAGQGLMDSWSRGRGMEPTQHNWWEPTPREEVDVGNPFQNALDFSQPGGGGTTSPGGNPNAGPSGPERGETLDRGTGVGNNVGRDNQDLWDRVGNDPTGIQDGHNEIFDREFQDLRDQLYQTGDINQGIEDYLNTRPPGQPGKIAEALMGLPGDIGDALTGPGGDLVEGAIDWLVGKIRELVMGGTPNWDAPLNSPVNPDWLDDAMGETGDPPLSSPDFGAALAPAGH